MTKLAVQVGTTSFRMTETLAANEVEYAGQWVFAADGVTSYMVWDAGLNNVRTMTQAEINAIPAQQLTAFRNSTASNAQATKAQDAMLMRAVCLTALDELNLHALKLNAILDAVDAATSLADLKTRIAAVADYPQRTKAQLYNAIVSKIQDGSAD